MSQPHEHEDPPLNPEEPPVEQDFPSHRLWKKARNRWDHARRKGLSKSSASQVGASQKRPAALLHRASESEAQADVQRRERHAANAALRGLLADTGWALDRDATLKLVEMSWCGLRAFLDLDADGDRFTRRPGELHSFFVRLHVDQM